MRSSVAYAVKAWQRLRPGGMDVVALPVYRRFLAAEVLFDFSSNIRLTAQSWLVQELTDSALWVGLAAGASGATEVLAHRPMCASRQAPPPCGSPQCLV